jgi:hypothetical protein
MARTFPGDFADRAYERFCAKRDREAQISKRGGHGNGHPLKSKTKIKQDDNTEPESENQRAFRKFFQQHGDLIRLRRGGKSLEEIAVETGGSRVGVLRILQRIPSNKLKLQLGIQTGGGLQ